MPETPVIAGWFGKMPSLGDFASRRLPEPFVHAWDDWVQHGMTSARAALGSVWLEHYLVAPIRRFWIAPGVIGTGAWMGLLMPSVDRVGRHFPLTVAAPAATLADALAQPGWFDAVDRAARHVLDPEFLVDDLEHELAAIASVPVDSDGAPAALADELLRPLRGNPAHHAARPGSVWWCNHADDLPRFLRFPALPPADAFVTLLSVNEPQDRYD